MLHRDLPAGTKVVCVGESLQITKGREYYLDMSYIVGDQYVTIVNEADQCGNGDGRYYLASRFSEIFEVGEISPKYIRNVIAALGMDYDKIEKAASALESAEKLKDNEDFKKFIKLAYELGGDSTFDTIRNVYITQE